MFMGLKIFILNIIFITAETLAKYDLDSKSNCKDRPTLSKIMFVNRKLFGSSIFSTDTDTTRLVKEVDENWFHQTLDHLNPKDQRKWKQVNSISNV